MSDINPNIKEWCTDLRSGKYPQAKCVLQDSTGYCCLGIGTLTAERLTGKKFPRDDEGYLEGTVWSSHPFTQLQEFYGIPSMDGIFKVTGELLTALEEKKISLGHDPHALGFTSSLITLNDSTRYSFSFEDIATVIEEVSKRDLWKREVEVTNERQP